MEKNTKMGKITNVGAQTFAQMASSVFTDPGSIMPERFTSVSSPTMVPVVAPELGSVSSVQASTQKSAESR